MDQSTLCLEVCCDTIEASRLAAQSGADRLELCSALEVGGLTPSLGFLQEIDSFITEKNLPVEYRVLLRCRSGDFIYSNSEIQVMLRDLLNIQDLNLKALQGFVVGALDPAGGPELSQLQDLESLLAPGLNLTFHRAIDICPLESLPKVCSSLSRFDTVLTSGGALKSIDGIPTLSEMLNLYGSRINVMVGSGVRLDTITKLKAELPRCRWFHASVPFSSVVEAPLKFGAKKEYDGPALQTLLNAVRDKSLR